jgi:hypothetical protein
MLIYIARSVSPHPLLFRMIMLTISSAAGVGFYVFSKQNLGRDAAAWGAVFFVTNPFLNEISLVPFQEMLMVCFLCFSLYSYIAGKKWIASLLFALACWTRYEAWLVAPVLILDWWRQHHWKRSAFLEAAGMFASGPLLWISMHSGLSSPGHYAVEIPRSAARLIRWVYLAWVCVKQTPLPVIVFALAGSWFFLRKRLASRGTVATILFVSLYLLATLAAAHGIPHQGMEDPEMFLGAREATLLVCCTILVAAHGLAELTALRNWTLLITVACVLAAFLGVLQSVLLVRSQATAPEPLVSYSIAQYLDQNVRPSERVLFVAKPFAASDWRYYLEQVARMQGSAGEAAAYKELNHFDLSPFDFQRTSIQSTLPERNLLVSASPICVDWIVIWNNTETPSEVKRALSFFRNAKLIRVGNLSAAIWHRHEISKDSAACAI